MDWGVRVEANLPGAVSSLHIFYKQCLTRKCLILKMKKKVMDYNIRNSPIEWQYINLYKSHTWAFSLALTIFEVFTFQNSWHWKCTSRAWCTTFAEAPLIANTWLPICSIYIFQHLLVKIVIWRVRPWTLRSISWNTFSIVIWRVRPWTLRPISWNTFSIVPFEANINLYKNHICEHFLLALTVFEIFRYKIRNHVNVGQGHDVQHLQWCYLMKNTLTSYLIANIKLHKSHKGNFCVSFYVRY